jgi:hypothetical protein
MGSCALSHPARACVWNVRERRYVSRPVVVTSRAAAAATAAKGTAPRRRALWAPAARLARD